MSAFICNHETIDNILSIVQNHDWLRKDCFLDKELRKAITNDVDGFLTNKVLTELGKKFLRLNIKSVNFRYDENIKYDHANSYKFKYREVPIIQSIKSLHCLMYQSCEIHNFLKNKTYKKMKELEKILTSSFIHNCQEYRDAEWG